MDYKKYIRSVPNFPKEGILFYDITTLLKEPLVLKSAILELVDKYKGIKVDKVVGMESRGFIFGSLLASELHCGFVPARKPGKLPAKTIKQEYSLEYGKDALEIHEDAISFGENVLVVDDLLATGGTALATCKLIEKLGGKIVSVCFMIELDFLNGREKLKDYNAFSLIHYDS